MIKKNLHFFDKDGYNLNFDWNSKFDYWEGNIYLPKVSVGIHANTSIYVLENVNGVFCFPQGSDSDKITFTWDVNNKFVDEFFMFNFDDSYIIKDTSALVYTPNDGPECETLIVNRFDEYEVSLDSNNLSKPLPIHIAFVANERYDATTYNRTLVMSYNGKTIARIKLFAETVEEDERLKVWNSNLGYNITPEDTMIFYNSDIKEYKPDYILLNEKRKELMMEGSNIYPYIGSYKAIINAIKFFGYDNLGIIEYWKNINVNDENFGKVYHSSRYSLTKKETLSVGARTISLPNADFKKINKIALVYSINEPTNKVDEWELPIVKEKFTYTIEEALIKLFALRKKLNNEFMPGSSRIIDVIGEANYFGIQAITKVFSTFGTHEFENKRQLEFEISPGNIIYLTDDRYFKRYIIEKNGEGTDSNSKSDFYNNLLLSNISNTSINDFGTLYGNDYKENYNLEYPDNAYQLYKDYYDEVFVKHTRYEKEQYNDTDDIGAPTSAKVLLTNTTFSDITFENCNLNFNSSISSIQNNHTTKWTITRSQNQFDDDCRNSDVKRNYYRGEYNDLTINDELSNEDKYSVTVYGDNIFITLPYIGYYDVLMEVETSSGTLKKIKKKYIKVEPYDIEIKGFYYDSRDIPDNIEHNTSETNDIYEYINSLLNKFIGWATTEKTRNLENLDSNTVTEDVIDFSLPTYSVLNEFINKGPYINSNIIYKWNAIDNVSYDISLLEPYVKYARYIRNGVDIKPYTWFLLTYNYGKIVGKVNPKWTLVNNLTGTKHIYEGKYFTCLIKTDGNYTINLSLEDTNGNKYEISRNIFVVSPTANYNIYQSYKKEYDNMIEQEQLALSKALQTYSLDES